MASLFGKLKEHEMEIQRLVVQESEDKHNKSITLKASKQQHVSSVSEKENISFLSKKFSTYPAKILKTLSIPPIFIEKYSFSHKKCLMVRKLLDNEKEREEKEKRERENEVKIEKEATEKKDRINNFSKKLINIEPKGKESNTSIFNISFLYSSILFKNVNQLNTLHRKNYFHHNCQSFQKNSPMDNYLLLPLFIHMFEYNINHLINIF